MADKITEELLDELEYAWLCDKNEFNELLEKYTGITAVPYTAFSYYDSAGNYVGDSEGDDIGDLLASAYVEVV